MTIVLFNLNSQSILNYKKRVVHSKDMLFERGQILAFFGLGGGQMVILCGPLVGTEVGYKGGNALVHDGRGPSNTLGCHTSA